MKRSIKILCSALLCISLLFTVTGCKTTGSGEQSKNSEKTSKTSQGTDSKAGSEPVKVTVFVNKAGPSDVDLSESANKALHDYFLEKCNVDYNYIMPPVERVEEKLNLLLASASTEIDAFYGNYQVYSSKKLIRPITKFYSPEKYPGIDKEFGEYMNLMIDSNSELWGTPRLFDKAAHPYEWRQDYAEKLGLKSPPETLDDLNTYLYAFRDKDPAGNGQTIPLISQGVEPMAWCLLKGYTDHGNALWLDETDGKVKLPIAQAGYEDFMAQLAKWYADGILYSEFYSIETQQLRELAASGRAASALDWYTAWGYGFSQIWRADPNTDAVGGFTHELKGPKGICETASKGDASGLIYSVKASNEKVEALLRMFELQCSDREAFYNATYGVDAWEFVDEEKKAIKIKTPEEMPEGWHFYGGYNIAQGMLVLDQQQYTVSEEDDLYKKSNGASGNPFDVFLYAYQHYPPVEKVFKPFDWRLPFNEAQVIDEVPAYSDVKRMIEEQQIKFVTGDRPLTEWNAFLDELYQAGMDRVEDAYTRQYESFQ